MDALESRAPARIGFNVEQAAESLGLRSHHIRQALASGELRSYGVGRRTVILRSDLEEFIRRRNPPKSSRRAINEECAYA